MNRLFVCTRSKLGHWNAGKSVIGCSNTYNAVLGIVPLGDWLWACTDRLKKHTNHRAPPTIGADRCADQNELWSLTNGYQLVELCNFEARRKSPVYTQYDKARIYIFALTQITLLGKSVCKSHCNPVIGPVGITSGTWECVPYVYWTCSNLAKWRTHTPLYSV